MSKIKKEFTTIRAKQGSIRIAWCYGGVTRSIIIWFHMNLQFFVYRSLFLSTYTLSIASRKMLQTHMGESYNYRLLFTPHSKNVDVNRIIYRVIKINSLLKHPNFHLKWWKNNFSITRRRLKSLVSYSGTWPWQCMSMWKLFRPDDVKLNIYEY